MKRTKERVSILVKKILKRKMILWMKIAGGEMRDGDRRNRIKSFALTSILEVDKRHKKRGKTVV